MFCCGKWYYAFFFVNQELPFTRIYTTLKLIFEITSFLSKYKSARKE